MAAAGASRGRIVAQRHQAKQFEEHLRTDLGRRRRRVVLGRDLHDVTSDDVEPLTAPDHLEALRCCEAGELGSTRPGRDRRGAPLSQHTLCPGRQA